MWIVVSWKEFYRRKMQNRAEICQGKDLEEATTNMKLFNAKKLKTTSDYRGFDLSELLESKSLEIIDKTLRA